MPQAEWVADRNGKITDAQLIGVGNGDLSQATCVLNLNQRDITLVIATNQFGIKFTPIIELHADFFGMIDDVIVSQHITFFGINNHA
ncbi:hypothetical protein D3C75_617640 [compost metagenome]